MSIRSAWRWWTHFAIVLGAVGFVLTWSSAAHAYPWMIRHGYTGCNACHADPSGGSLLTPYGRAQGELLLRTRYGSELQTQDPGDIGNFLFGAVTLPDSLLLGADIRAAEYDEAIPGAPPVTELIWMQADLEGQVTIADRIRLNASVGYVPQGDLPDSLTRSGTDNLISRVHWVGVDLGADKDWTLRAGKMNLPFGIRSVEHTYWVRTATGTDIDSTQEYGAAAAYNGNSLRGELMLIAGNFEVSPDDFRQRGYAGYVEWAPIEKLGVGVSSLATHTADDITLLTPAWRQAHGVFGRYSPLLPLVITTEWDATIVSQPATATIAAKSTLGLAGMLQADVEVLQGVHLSTTGEFLNSDLSGMPSSFGWWATAWWFFGPHIDLRADAILQNLPSGSTRTSATTLLAQLHAFL